MRTVSILILLLLAGCAPFSGMRQNLPWAQEYNYLKGQRVAPEEIGIHATNVGPYTMIFCSQGIVGEEKVTVPLSFSGGALTTPVQVNGHKRVPAVVDTGAPFNLVSLTLAYNLNLPVTRPKSLPQRIGGYGGASSECAWSVLKSIQMGGITYTNSLVSIPLEKFDQVSFFGFVTMNRDEFVIFGLDDMARMSHLTLDFPRGQFTFRRREPYIRAGNGDAIVAPCQVGPGPILVVEIKVDGKGPFRCRVDTGKTFNAPALTIPQKFAQELGYWQETGRRSNQMGIGGRFESQRFKLKTFEIGGRSFPNVTADTHEGAGDFILGMKFLREYRMTIDFLGRNIYLEK